MATTKKAINIKRKKFADLIRKGRDDYPNVAHVRQEWIQWSDENDEPIAACAVGYAMLGKWDGKMNRGDYMDYADKIDKLFHYKVVNEVGTYYETISGQAMEMNDSRKLSLDQIIAEFETSV